MCDDDSVFLDRLQNRVQNYIVKSKYGDYDFKIESFNNPNKALQKCKEENPNIVFLDIDMPEVNGFNIAKDINDSNNNTIIIFVSSHDNYVYTSLRFKPFRFLRKSHISNEISEALNSALTETINKDQFLELGSKYFNERVFLSEILYFESKRNYAELTTLDNRKLLYRSTLKKMENELKPFYFVRVHSAFLINMKHIKHIEHEFVKLTNDEKIRISRRMYSQLINAYSIYMRR